MSNNYRELTGREKQRIKKLITSRCASYDKEYGCLPLDCDCPMFGICYTNSGLCSYFRKYVLPTEPEPAADKPQQEYANTDRSTIKHIQCNHFALRKPCAARIFPGHFYVGNGLIPVALF